jgi:hypothetical protein
MIHPDNIDYEDVNAKIQAEIEQYCVKPFDKFITYWRFITIVNTIVRHCRNALNKSQDDPLYTYAVYIKLMEFANI